MNTIIGTSILPQFPGLTRIISRGCLRTRRDGCATMCAAGFHVTRTSGQALNGRSAAGTVVASLIIGKQRGRACMTKEIIIIFRLQ